MNLIFKAFEQLHAEEELKKNTKQFLISRSSKRLSFRPARLAVSLCMLALCALSAFGIYSAHAQAAYIQLDSRARIGLSVNCWEKVIKATGLNPEGLKVLESLKITGLSYQEAVDIILDTEEFCGYVKGDSEIQVSVSSGDHEMEQNIEEDVTTQCHDHVSEHHGEEETGSGDVPEASEEYRHGHRENSGHHSGKHEE